MDRAVRCGKSVQTRMIDIGGNPHWDMAGKFEGIATLGESREYTKHGKLDHGE